jgi:hypothetical protein
VGLEKLYVKNSAGLQIGNDAVLVRTAGNLRKTEIRAEEGAHAKNRLAGPTIDSPIVGLQS